MNKQEEERARRGRDPIPEFPGFSFGIAYRPGRMTGPAPACCFAALMADGRVEVEAYRALREIDR